MAHIIDRLSDVLGRVDKRTPECRSVVISFCALCPRCGDMIVAVNGLSTAGMSHSALVPMLKEQRSRVALTVVSWPGSLA